MQMTVNGQQSVSTLGTTVVEVCFKLASDNGQIQCLTGR